MRRQTAVWALAALLGIVLTAAITWATSQLTSQHIGISSEPISAGTRLAPPVAERAVPRRSRSAPTVTAPTTSAPSAPTPSQSTASTPTAPVQVAPTSTAEPAPARRTSTSSADDSADHGNRGGSEAARREGAGQEGREAGASPRRRDD